MHYYLADREAARNEPQARALLLDANGHVTEASTANVLIYHKAEGVVGPHREKVLPGVSLAYVLQLCHELGITTTERDLTPDDVARAEEVLLSSTPFCLLSVTRFNSNPIGDGQPGALFHRLVEAWSKSVGVDIIGQAMQFQHKR